MAADKKPTEISTRRRYVSNAALALCIAVGAFCGLVLFGIAQALAGIGAGLARSSYMGPYLAELIIFPCGGALLGSLPGFGLRALIRHSGRGNRQATAK